MTFQLVSDWGHSPSPILVEPIAEYAARVGATSRVDAIHRAAAAGLTLLSRAPCGGVNSPWYKHLPGEVPTNLDMSMADEHPDCVGVLSV